MYLVFFLFYLKMETSWNLKLFAGIRSFAPLRCWNGLKIRNIEHHDLCRCPSLSDTVLVLHKCKKHTEKQWLPPAVCLVWTVCVFVLCCWIVRDVGECVHWTGRRGGIRCEVEQKEKEAGQGSCTECFESWNNTGGRNPVSLRPGSFQSHMEVTFGRRLSFLKHGKCCLHIYLFFTSNVELDFCLIIFI